MASVDLNTMRGTAKFTHCKHGLQSNCSFLFGDVNFNTINCGLEGLQRESYLCTESVASGVGEGGSWVVFFFLRHETSSCCIKHIFTCMALVV